MGNTSLKSIRFVFKNSFTDILLISILGIINAILSLLSVMLSNDMVANLSNTKNEMNNKFIISLSLYIFVLLFLFLYNNYFVRYWIQFKGVTRFERKCRVKIHKKALEISNEEFEKPELDQNLTNALNSATNLYRLTQTINSIIVIIFNVVLVTTYISSFNIIYILFIPFTLIPTIVDLKYQEKSTRMNYLKLKHIYKMNQAYFNSFYAIDAIKDAQMLNMYSLINKKSSNLLDEKDKIEIKKNTKLFFISLILSPIKLLGDSMGIILSTYLLYKQRINIAEFTAGISSYLMIMSNIKALFELYLYQKQFEIMNKPFFTFFEKPNRSGDAEKSFNKAIIFKNVSFSYGNQKVLKNISLTIKKGEKIALVGKNGSGKTTLVNLILGLYLPSAGSIYYDLDETSQIKEQALHKNQSMVQQNPIRYNISLKDNIEFGANEIDTRELIKDLAIDIDENMIVGLEFGKRDFSGGQWQMISIYRGLGKRHDIIVLDEPSSALDAFTEKKIFSKFNEISNDTMIIVSHKLKNIKDCDTIYVLNDGQIIEHGTHNELLSKPGLYREMWLSQATLYDVNY